LLLSTAAKVAGLLWPEFREIDGAIVLASVTARPVSAWNGTVTEYERFYGHTHVQDLFTWRVPMVRDAEWDTEVPDAASPEFAAAWELARKVGAMWLAKLAADFPAYRFRVYLTKLSDPVIHFHRVRDGERPWLTDDEARDQVAGGTLVVFDTGPRVADAGVVQRTH
jgi:hypothetical protein